MSSMRHPCILPTGNRPIQSSNPHSSLTFHVTLTFAPWPSEKCRPHTLSVESASSARPAMSDSLTLLSGSSNVWSLSNNGVRGVGNERSSTVAGWLDFELDLLAKPSPSLISTDHNSKIINCFFADLFPALIPLHFHIYTFTLSLL